MSSLTLPTKLEVSTDPVPPQEGHRLGQSCCGSPACLNYLHFPPTCVQVKQTHQRLLKMVGTP